MKLRRNGFLQLVLFSLCLQATEQIVYASDSIASKEINLNEIPGLAKYGNCSGIIFKFDSSRSDDKALFLTNGHCVHLPGHSLYLKYGDFYYNMLFNKNLVLNSSGQEITTKRLIYSTMTSTDIALFELENTYEELGIEALVLGRNKMNGTPEEIVVPSSYHGKLLTGKTSGLISVLQEATWKWNDAIILDLAGDFKKGSSGSPVILRSTGQITAIGNTGNDGKPDCSIGNPCEVTEGQTTHSFPGRIYAQQVYQLYDCLDSKNVFNLYLETCPLPK